MAEENFAGFQISYLDILPYCVCIFGAIIHVFLIIAFIKDPIKCFKNSGTYLVVNLAASDFLVCLITPTKCCIPKNWHWQWPRHLVVFSSMNVSILTIASISLDRFFLIVYPFKHRGLTRGKKIFVWLACIWLIGSAYPAKNFVFSVKTDVDTYIRILTQILPVLFASVVYGLTYYALKKQSQNLALENILNRQQQARIMREKQFLKTIIIVACIQVVCVVPSTIFFHMNVFQKLFSDGLTVEVLNEVSSGIFHINFAVNPLVYVVRLPNYKKTFSLLYCCKVIQR